MDIRFGECGENLSREDWITLDEGELRHEARDEGRS